MPIQNGLRMQDVQRGEISSDGEQNETEAGQRHASRRPRVPLLIQHRVHNIRYHVA